MYFKPFLDNIETVGSKLGSSGSGFEPLNFETESRKRIKANRRRGNRISSLSRTARRKADEVERYIHSHPGQISSQGQDYLAKFIRDLNQCCCKSLYRQHLEGDQLEYLGSLTCKHKLCPVCNAEGSKILRRKYILYFQKHPELLADYDFQHLTLTVPHSATGGFRGKKLYGSELMYAFNLMRKKEFWQSLVYAGEFGLEVTKNDNGLHIHIHSLLLVKKQKQNRNLLHRGILAEWNRLTVDPSLSIRKFSDSDRLSIKAGNRQIDDGFIDSLDSRGATIIGLENLYVVDSGNRKRYVDMTNQEDFLKGLMECIKYHFEPFVLDKSDGSYDYDLLLEALPMIKGRPLYRKFGAFHGVKELNVNDRSLIKEEMAEAVKETAHDTVINPESLQVAGRDEYGYVILSAAKVRYLPEENLRPVVSPYVVKDEVPYPFDRSLSDAVLYMISKSVDEGKKRATRGVKKRKTVISTI